MNPVQNKTFETFNPATGAKIADVASATEEDVHFAVQAAKASLHSPTWGYASTPAQRALLLRNLGSLISDKREDLALLDSLDEGKPLRESQADMNDAVAACGHFADLLEEREGGGGGGKGEEIENGTDGAFVTRVISEPVGVVAAITPWNYPFLMGIWKVVPALAAGCSIVLKPSELAPLSCLLLAELCAEAGFPPGSLNVLTGFGPAAGTPLVSHPDVDKVSFTGSVPTARRVMALAASGPRAVSLELGGKSPLILFADGDLPSAVDWMLTGILWGSGQVCSATSRVIAHSSLRDALLAALEERISKIQIRDSTGADALADSSSPAIGPVVSRSQYDKIWAYIDGAVAGGLKPVIGGDRKLVAHLDAGGCFVPPTVFVDVPTSAAIWNEEIFGPVLCIRFFDDEEEAVRLANDSVYGLAASVFSKDEVKCERAVKGIRAGVVWVNCSQPAFVQAPWGGVKQSGFGRELGKWGLEEFQIVKQVTGCKSGFSWNLW